MFIAFLLYELSQGKRGTLLVFCMYDILAQSFHSHTVNTTLRNDVHEP